MPALRPVLLSGGAGTRLWPLSTPPHPKQFAPLLPGRTLFGRTLGRFAGRPEFDRPFVVTSVQHLDFVAEEAAESGTELAMAIAEPVGRNTAPACVAAALVSEPDDVLLVVPSDHLIRDEERFIESVLAGADLAREGFLVTFGVLPDGPETGYGYIQPGEPCGKGSRVTRFIEKPDAAKAASMIAKGFLWNAGIFAMGAGTLLEEARIHAPGLVEAVNASLGDPVDGVLRLTDRFADVDAVSIDVGIMEKTDQAATIPLDVGWSDLGSYDALWAALERDSHGNATGGDAVLVDVEGSLVLATGRTVGVAGLDDVVVVETEDAVLVVRRDRAQLVRDLVARMSENPGSSE